MEVIALVIIVAVVVILQSVIITKFVPYRLDYKCYFSTEQAHVGDELFLVETIHNRKLLPVLWLKVDIHSSKWLDFAGANSVIAQDDRRVTSNFYVGGYKRITRKWKLRCLKRGIFPIENATLVWGDMLGFDTGSAAVPVGASLTVFPELIDLEKTFVSLNYLQGDTIVKRWVVDDPFLVSGVREYTAADPLNRIHWRATAREGRLMVKKNDFTSQMSLTILLNIQTIEYEMSQVVDRDIAELGIKTAATLIDRSLRMGFPVRFGTNACIPPDDDSVFTDRASGREHASMILKLLAGMKLKSRKNFDVFLEDVYSGIGTDDVVIITAYLNGSICYYARQLIKQRNNVRIILLSSSVNVGDLPDDLDIMTMVKGGTKHEGEYAQIAE